MKKKAFTLTELLVVVVIIGVLSAVILPKFNKMLETRKTTEAEEMMAAVRSEQEARCLLDKPYFGKDQIGQLTSLPNANTKNFTYALTDDGGVTATNSKSNYTLEIPSYADGRICCSGDGCSSLNKNYPSCSSLKENTDDFVNVPAACLAEVGEEPEPKSCDNGAKPQDLEEKCDISDYPGQNCGMKTKGWHCSEATGYAWQEDASYGECMKTSKCQGCDPHDPLAGKKAEESCYPAAYPDEKCGKRTKAYECDASTGYKWQLKDSTSWSSCVATADCPNPSNCITEYDRIYDETGEDLFDTCWSSGRIFDFNNSEVENRPLAEGASVAEWLNTCCDCCPEGTSPYQDTSSGHWTFSCEPCEKFGSNYYWDSAAGGACPGACVPKFKPAWSNDFMAVCNHGIYAPGYTTDYDEACQSGMSFYGDNSVAKHAIIKGHTVPYSKDPCSTCDKDSATCDEVGYGYEAYQAHIALCAYDEGELVDSGDMGPGCGVRYTRPRGYELAAFSQHHTSDNTGGDINCFSSGADWLRSQAGGSVGFCTKHPSKYEMSGDAYRYYPNSNWAGDHLATLFFVPKYKKVKGYTCVAD